jgi:hypothetical protein
VVRYAALLSLLFALAFAQDGLYRLPDHLVQVAPGVVEVRGNRVLTYLEGLGWLPDGPATHPIVIDGAVYVSDVLLDYLDIALPRLERIRSSDTGTIRLVLDLANLPVTAVQGLRQEGQLDVGGALTIPLPSLLLPLELPDTAHGIELALRGEASGTALTVSAANKLAYRVFSLDDPVRVVVDLQPLGFAQVTEAVRDIAPGIRHRRFAAPTETGSSGVHLIEVAPGAGEFRVVGEPLVPRTLSELASGGIVAINAGYYDPATFQAIGFLQVDYTLLSLPSRNRASIGFGSGAPIIGRVQAEVRVWVNGQLHYSESLNGWGQGQIAAYTHSGALVGNPTRGVIVVQEGRAIANKIGPRRVPEGGFAIVYAPELRALALVDAGDQVALEVRYLPADFNQVRYAVEAGPLLVQGGFPALDPALEHFAQGVRILDGRTQQSAIGVRPDGTVLLVAADNMVAHELVPLFLSLGASYAMRLDSGTRSTLYAAGRILNRSSERPIVSAIVLVPTQSGQAP